MNIIEVNNIVKEFSKKKACDNVTFTLASGEILGLIGPSGAGKTTIVKSLMGMEKCDKGSITIFNTPIPNRESMLRIGYMGQGDALYTSLTAKENLLFFGKMMQMNGNDLEIRIKYIATFLNLDQDLNKKVTAYSGGMKRRLSLAIAMIQNPPLLILDEPTVGIDPVLRASIWNELTKMKNAQQSIIITTHAMDEAEKCDRLLLIREGKIIAQGTPKELKNQYSVSSIEEVFIKAGEKNA